MMRVREAPQRAAAAGENERGLRVRAPSLAAIATAVLAGLALIFALAACGVEEEVAPTAATATATPGATPVATATAQPSPTPGLVSTAGPVPSGSVTYADPRFGYSFDYPAAWHLSPAEENGGSNVILYSYDPASAAGDGRPVPQDKLKVFFWVAEGVDKPVLEWLAEGDNSPGQISPPNVLSQSDTSLGGKQGVTRVTESDGVKSRSYYLPIGVGLVFVVNAGPADSLVWPQFEPVLASLRFSP